MKQLPNNVRLKVLALLLAWSCSEDRAFVFEGHVTNMENGVTLFLKDHITRKVIDSASVIDNSFRFSGSLSDEPALAILHTRDYSDYRYVWIENKKIRFTSKKGDFRNALVTGSETDRLQTQLSKAQQPLQIRYDSIFELSDHNLEAQKERAEELEILRGRLQDLEVEFIRNNPGNLSSAYMLNVYKTAWGRSITDELFSGFSNEIKNSYYGKNVSHYLALNKDPKPGDRYVDFIQENASGEKVRLSDFENKVVLVEFWSSYCGPCRVANPKLARIYKRFNDRGFEILSVALDYDRDDWLKATKTDGIIWESVSDLKGDENEAAIVYGVAGIPDNVLIDRQGRIVARQISPENLETRLDELLTANL